MYKKVIFIILIVVLMITIFKFSDENNNKSQMRSGAITSVVQKLTKTIAPGGPNKHTKVYLLQNKEKLNYIIRKITHGTEYFLLCFLFFRLFVLFNFKAGYKYIISFIFSILFACSDEIHQLHITGRNGAVRDVFIDSIGISLAMLLCLILRRNIKEVK